MPELNELFDARNKIVEDQRAMVDLADKENRDFSDEETEKYDKMDKDFEDLSGQIDEEKKRQERARQRKESLELREKDMQRSVRAPHKEQPDNRETRESRGPEMPEGLSLEMREALKTYRERTDCRYAVADYMQAARAYMINQRALQADIDTGGGYVVAPENFVVELIKGLDNEVFVRRYARKFPVANADSLGCPVLDADPSDPVWTAEILTGDEDSSMKFEKRDLHPQPLAKRIKISKTLIRKSLIPVEMLVGDRLGYKCAVTMENAFLNGNGPNQPLGVMVASDFGISTSRDVSTGNDATQIKADGLIECKYSLKSQYWSRVRWCFHRDAIKNIRKLKDGAGDYLWRAGIASDRPDTILDLPYDISEYMPHTFTASLYVGILADWSFYWIADALNMEIQALTELYAETNQNGYVLRAECDGMPVLEEAFARVKLGS